MSRLSIEEINPQEAKVTSAVFVEHLEWDLLPACETLYPHGDYIIVLDAATSHSAKKTQDYLRTYAPRFVPAEKWPPTSPDLNPMDYYVWDALQRKCINVDASHLRVWMNFRRK